MLFGLIEAPGVFQALVNSVLRDFLNHIDLLPESSGTFPPCVAGTLETLGKQTVH